MPRAGRGRSPSPSPGWAKGHLVAPHPGAGERHQWVTNPAPVHGDGSNTWRDPADVVYGSVSLLRDRCWRPRRPGKALAVRPVQRYVRLPPAAACVAALVIAASAHADENGPPRRARGHAVKARAHGHGQVHVQWGVAPRIPVATYRPAPVTVVVVEDEEHFARVSETPRDHGYGGFTGFALVVPPSGASLQGGGLGFRIHGAPAIALDLSAARAWGTDALDRRRVENLGALTALLYPSPGGTLQPYFPVGLLLDTSSARDDERTRRFRHFGGFAGCGLEVFLSRDFSLFGDARVMLRTRVGGEPGPEFGQGSRSTSTSVGLALVLGAAWYPFGKK